MGDLPTFNDYFRVGEEEILARSDALTRDSVERAGADANIFVAASASSADDVTGQLANVEASLFLASAQREKLDRLVFDRYGLTRKPAAVAMGSVNFTTATPAPGAFNIPAGTKLSTSDGRQFVTFVDATYPMGSMGPVVVEVRSVSPGSDQQAAVGAITSIVTTPTGAASDLVVSNSLATVGADDAELDDSLRQRAQQFFVTARRATLAALVQGARAVAGVRTATAFEFTDALGRPARVVQLVISDAFTNALVDLTPTPFGYQTQSQALASTVFNALDDVRAAGIDVTVIVAQVVLQGVNLGLRFKAGVNADLVALQARSAVAATINSLSPGRTLRQSDLILSLRAVSGLIITGNEILSPPGDVIPLPLQVLRAPLSLVVAATVQADRALQGSANADGV